MFDPTKKPWDSPDYWRFARTLPRRPEAAYGPYKDKPAALADRIIMTIVVVVSVPWIIVALLSRLGVI